MSRIYGVAAPVPEGQRSFGGILRRKCQCGQHASGGDCEECRKKKQFVQRQIGSGSESAGVPAEVTKVLRSPGRPLPASIRSFMEPRFSHDFGQVRVHVGNQAAAAARSVNALAFTVGHHIAFAEGRFSPESMAGRKLLAHELAHVVQQSDIRGEGGPLELGGIDGGAEREAEDHADRALSEADSPIASVGQSRATLQRMPESGGEMASQAAATDRESPAVGCSPGPGTPNSNCSAYWGNAWWLPIAYAHNATCACAETPNTPTANCVRKYLQDRLAATPNRVRLGAAALKPLEANPTTYSLYQASVQALLTPRIHGDHVDAYRDCCCPSGPASYPAWIGVTSVPLPCSVVGFSIRRFGSCHGTPGRW